MYKQILYAPWAISVHEHNRKLSFRTLHFSFILLFCMLEKKKKTLTCFHLDSYEGPRFLVAFIQLFQETLNAMLVTEYESSFHFMLFGKLRGRTLLHLIRLNVFLF